MLPRGDRMFVYPRQFIGRIVSPGTSIRIEPKDPEVFRQVRGILSNLPGHQVPAYGSDGSTPAAIEPPAAFRRALASAMDAWGPHCLSLAANGRIRSPRLTAHQPDGRAIRISRNAARSGVRPCRAKYRP